MPRLTRDAVTWLLYSQLGLYGYFIYGFGPAVPLLRDDQGVSRAVSGLHGTAVAVGVLVAAFAGPRLVGSLGRGRTLWAGVVGMLAGIVLFCATPALPLTLAGAALAGLFGSLVVNGTAAALSDYHGAAGPAAVSEANATAAAAGTVAPLVLGLAAASALGWRAGLLLTLPLAAVLAAVAALRGIHLPSPPPVEASGSPAGRATAGRSLPRAFWAAWAVLLLCISVEFSLTFWASELLVSRAGLAAGSAAAGITALVAGMTVGRLVGARLALRHPVDTLLLVAIGTALAGFGLFWVATAPLLALAGLVLAGLGVSLHFPLGISRAIAAADGRSDLATGRSALAAALAIGGAPFLLGALADGVGAHRAMLVVPVLLVAAATLVAWTRRRPAGVSGAAAPVPAPPRAPAPATEQGAGVRATRGRA